LKKGTDILSKMLQSLEIVLEVIASILLAIFCIAVMSQVITRFVFSAPLAWTEEISKYSFIYMLFTGCSVGVRRLSHYSFDAFAKVKSAKVKKLISVLALALQIGFFGFLLYTSILFIPQMDARLSPVLRMRMSIPYSSILVFSAVGLIFTLEHAVRTIIGKELVKEKEESYLD